VIGRIEALWTKRAHRGPMDSVPEATLVAGQGMQGSVGRSRRRQVTILAREAWNAATAVVGLDPGAASRRANILVSGIELARTRGRVLVIGSCRVLVGGELTPCERMDETAPGLRRALEPDWRGGVFGEVLEGGTVRVGDRVAWETDSASVSPASRAPA
jgi:MOSC domain-containing protein YiiM